MQAIQRQVPPILAGIDPYSTPTVINPYPFHAALRDFATVVELENYGVYAMGRYEEIRQVLMRWDDFSSASGAGIQDIRKPGRFRVPSRLVEVDPPDHTEVRSAVVKVLSPKIIRAWRELFEDRARAHVERIVEMREFDAMQDFAEPYIIEVFQKAVGVRLPRDNVLAIGEYRFNQTGPENELYHAAAKQAEPYLEWFEHSVERGGILPGSIGEQIYAAEDRGEIKEGVAKSVVRSLVGGGTDTTMAGIGHCLRLLSHNPEQMRLAAETPLLMRTALDEAIRLESPSQIIYRVPNRDMEFGGFHLEKDRKLGLWLGAGNRDPRKWLEPDKFDLTRGSTGVHVAFGAGIHVCIGQMIARLESECLLVEFARRVKNIEPAGEPEPRPMNTVRALKHVPVRVTPK